jgi:hypothetical protein
MLILWWWLDVWSHWLAVVEAAMPPPPVGPHDGPPDGGTVVNMAHWRRTHPTPNHNGWAASPRIGPEARPTGSTAAAAGET